MRPEEELALAVRKKAAELEAVISEAVDAGVQVFLDVRQINQTGKVASALIIRPTIMRIL